MFIIKNMKDEGDGSIVFPVPSQSVLTGGTGNTQPLTERVTAADGMTELQDWDKLTELHLPDDV